MEETSQQTSSNAPTEVSAPVVDTSSAESHISDSGVESSSPGGEAPKAYIPNYRFKVLDKEHEVDEFIRPAIKDADAEKKIKELYEKAYGLDEVKSSREKVRSEYQAYKSQTEPLVGTVREAAQLYQSAINAYKSGNQRKGIFQMEEAFKHLGIDDQVLKQYVFNKLQAAELDPEQKAYYNQHRELEIQNAQMQRQMHEFQRQAEQLQVQTRTQELTQVLSNPEITNIVKSFDARNGLGSFQNEVILRGQQIYNLQGRDASAEEVVSDIIKKYGLQSAHSQTIQPAASAGVVAPQEVPVIPVVKAGSTSGVGKNIATVEDLSAYRKQKYGY